MDDLLRRLRHDMVELWSQGEDYTHQIWLMYGEFKQVVDTYKIDTPSNEDMESTTMMNERFDVSDYESDNEPEVPSLMGRVYGKAQRPGLNPLLDTISVIGDLCDSDDAIDGPVTGCLYAGSNSVDSGYKSACPTPDLDNYIQRPPAMKPRRPPPLPDAASAAAPEALDLDHLASLRQTLLSAIERYDFRTKQIDRDLQTTMAERRPRSASPRRTANVQQLISQAAKLHSQGRLEQQQPGEQQDGAVRFSRVARCMLEIIEDLQRQQQQHQQQQQHHQQQQQRDGQQAENKAPAGSSAGPKVPPKPVRMSIQNKLASMTNVTNPQLVPAPATPPRVARRGRRKLPTPQPPPSDDEDEEVKPANGDPDYHLYEEIIYDLAPSHAANKNAQHQELPPPLPARPSRHPAVVQELSCGKPWLSAIKPFRRDRNNQLVRQTPHWTATKLHIDRPPRSNNFYTFGSQVTNANACSTGSLKIHHEDEYGFRAPVSHMV